MKRFILAAVLALFCMTGVTPAEARGGAFLYGFGLGTAVGVGAGCCGYYSHYYAPYYGYGSYYAPYNYGYPVYYAQPPQTVIYAQPAPAPVTYIAPPAPQATEATQASDVFVDDKGRTCRTFQSSFNGAPVQGKACLRPDGTWHTVAG